MRHVGVLIQGVQNDDPVPLPRALTLERHGRFAIREKKEEAFVTPARTAKGMPGLSNAAPGGAGPPTTRTMAHGAPLRAERPV
jgi:hypothetical protein